SGRYRPAGRRPPAFVPAACRASSGRACSGRRPERWSGQTPPCQGGLMRKSSAIGPENRTSCLPFSNSADATIDALQPRICLLLRAVLVCRGSVMKRFTVVATFVFLSLLAVAQTPDKSIDRSKLIPLSQIQTGMRGTAYTVFQGVKPEPMEVEVLG